MSRSGSGCWHHVKVATAAALLGGFFLDQDPSGIGSTAVCASAVAFLLVQLLVQNLRQREGVAVLISTSSYCRRDFLRQPWVCHGICHAFTSLTLLGSLLWLLTTLRLLPDLLKYADGQAFQAELLGAFPAGVELLVANQTLRVRGPPGRAEGGAADLRVGLSHMLLEVCGGAYHEMGRDVGNLGVADMHLLDQLLIGKGFLSPLAARIGGSVAAGGPKGGDPYVRVTELEVGEEVEVRVGEELFGCGLPRPFLPAPIAGLWRPAVVEEVHASTKMQEFHYTVRLEADDADAAAGLAGLQCRVWAPNLRRRHLSALFRLGDRRAPAVGSELQAARAVLVFEASRFAILEGYSFQHRSHWQYVSSDDKDERKKNRATVWHNYTRGEINSYFPLSCAAGLFCKEVAGEEAAEGPAGKGDLLCSREVGREKVEDLLSQERALSLLLHSSLHVPFALGLLWVSSVVATLCCRFLVVALVYTPIAYVACGLLRHVDTPLVGVDKILGLVLYSSTIPTWLFRLSNCIWKVWGTDDFLHPWLQSPTEWVTLHPFLLMSFWALWNGHLVIQMREYITSQEHQQRCPPPPPGHRSGSRPARQPPPPPSAASGAGASGADGDDSSEPMCRICFGGREAGRLISPCLCSGTMRFVHIDCLTVWRLGSANPMSSYQCDQCKYRYSFRRTLSAKILRSAFVLHAVTLAAFALVVLLGALFFSLLEQWLKTPSADGLVSDELVQKLANDTELSPEVIREQLTQLANASWHGLHLAHVIWGFALVGYSGFISLGFYWLPDLRRGDRGVPFVLLLGSLIGSVRVMVGLYSYFKQTSGWLLQSVENLIIEVGDPAAIRAHRRAEAAAAAAAAPAPVPAAAPATPPAAAAAAAAAPPRPAPAAAAGPPPAVASGEVGSEDGEAPEEEEESCWEEEGSSVGGGGSEGSEGSKGSECDLAAVERLEDERDDEGEGEFGRVEPGGAAEPELVPG